MSGIESFDVSKFIEQVGKASKVSKSNSELNVSTANSDTALFKTDNFLKILGKKLANTTNSTKTSSPELSDEIATLFSKIDTDNNGGISEDELQIALSAASGASTGATTIDISKLFNAIDTDGDGKITLDELTNFIKAHHKHHHHPMGGASKAVDIQKVFSEMDTNQDGIVSLAELIAYYTKQGITDTSTEASTTTSTSTTVKTTTTAVTSTT